MFLIIFRIWVNNVPFNERHFTSSIADPIDIEHDVVYTPIKFQEEEFIKLSEISRFLSNESYNFENNFLYIYPLWPDTLSFNIHEGVVDNHSGSNTDPYRKIISPDN
jgi:hypothetical protein